MNARSVIVMSKANPPVGLLLVGTPLRSRGAARRRAPALQLRNDFPVATPVAADVRRLELSLRAHGDPEWPRPRSGPTRRGALRRHMVCLERFRVKHDTA